MLTVMMPPINWWYLEDAGDGDSGEVWAYFILTSYGSWSGHDEWTNKHFWIHSITGKHHKCLPFNSVIGYKGQEDFEISCC